MKAAAACRSAVFKRFVELRDVRSAMINISLKLVTHHVRDVQITVSNQTASIVYR